MDRKQYIKKDFFLKTAVAGFFLFFSFSSLSASRVIEGVDYIYLHIGLQMDHPLPESFQKEQLKFEGNYKRYTKAVYRKKSNDIRFNPIRKGSSVMIIKNKEDKIIARLNIDVQKDNLHKIAAELRDLLIAIDGIEVKIYNKKVIIDGQVLLPREMDRIEAVLAQYNPKLVQSLVTYSPEAQKKIAELIEKEIGYPEVTVRYAYNRFLLEGCVTSQDEKVRAESIAKLYTQFEVSSVGKGAARKGFPVIKNQLAVPCESQKKEDEEKKKKTQIKKLIQIVVHFVEMEKSFNKGFLFQWTPAIADGETQVTAQAGNVPGAPRGLTAALQATVSNFFPKLNWAKSFDFARVLHNSSILVEDQGTGTISIATNIPTLQNQNGQIVSGTSTSAQVSTEVVPEIIGDRSNLIKMGIGVAVTTPAVKGSTSRTIKTTIHVRDGASAVIGGLISSFLSRGYNNKDPSTTQAQPLLSLYSQKDYITKKSQFVVFITPLIKSQSHLGVERIKQKFKLDE